MVEIKELKPTKRNLLKFVHFPIDNLYADNPYYVPALVTDEVDTLDPTKNPAFDFCESAYFMAYRDGKPVGRIAGIINHVVNKRSGMTEGRFGFIDFIDDEEVVDALIDAVENWARGKGMTRLTGPLGFTDMDPEGMLIEGFDQLGTQATIYNLRQHQVHVAPQTCKGLRRRHLRSHQRGLRQPVRLLATERKANQALHQDVSAVPAA